MRKIILISSILLITIQSYSQEVIRIIPLSDEQIEASCAKNLNQAKSAVEAKDFAKKDIDNDTPFLLLISGSAPSVHSTDFEFQRKFKVYYFDFGDTGQPDIEFINAYNSTIFDYLDNKFGKQWIRLIRSDVIGYKERKID